MSEAGHHELIIIKRHDEEEHEHHSSAWKVAHADFMTAMMAFFLIMWLINVTDENVRKGISQYFNPIHMSEGSTAMKGLAKSEGKPQEGKHGKGGTVDSQAQEFNPMKMSPGSSDEKSVQEKASSGHDTGAPSAAAATAHGAAEAAAGESGAGPEGGAKAGEAPAGALAAMTAGENGGDGAARERAAFQDPYAVLAKLAAGYERDHPVSADAIAGDTRPIGLGGGDVDRDPFDPTYWQVSPLPAARTDHPGDPLSAAAAPTDALPDAAAPPPGDTPPEGAVVAMTAAPPPAPVAAPSVTPPVATPPAAEAPPPSPAEPAPVEPLKAEATEPAKIEAAAPQKTEPALDAEMAQSMRETMGAAPAPDLTVTETGEGTLIDLTDDADFSMFGVGSAIPDARVVVLMEKIARTLSERTGDVIIRGYTDGRPFHSDTYDNWRLSAARAHMAYYMLVRGGLDEHRVVAIEGYADRSLKNASDPNAAENRRIEIFLKQSAEAP